MLRLDLKDKDSTVLFIDVMIGVKIYKSQPKVLYDDRYGLIIKTSSDVCCAVYDSEEHRDEAYDYVLNKINEYLFPQIETSDVCCYVGEEKKWITEC